MLKINAIKIEYLSKNVVTDNKAPRFTFEAGSDEQNCFAAFYRLKVSCSGSVVWDTGKTQGSDIANIVYSGAPLLPLTEYTVEGTLWDNLGNEAAATTFFSTGRLGTAWKAKWITHPTYSFSRLKNPVPFVFKKELSLSKEIEKAEIFSTATGIYTINIGGRKIGDDYFAPGYTSYKSFLQYQIYNVTEELKKDSVLYCTVAGGWFCSVFGLIRQSKQYEKMPSLLCEIHIKYKDGSSEIIGTDETWLVTTDGPVRDASFYDGEVYDAGKDIAAAKYENAKTRKLKIKPDLLATYGSLPKIIDTLKPVNSFSSKNGTIYDFGQNFAGTVNLKIKAHNGQLIKVRHAEVLIENELFTKPLRSAKARIQYICREGEQTYTPLYTFMGFRYIEICGIDSKDVEVSANVISSAYDETAFFECSNADINRLQQNIIWSGRSNFIDIPTDCPQRDERLGWTGDIAMFASTACFNFDMSRFLEKWLKDLGAEQKADGRLPVVIPNIKLSPVIVTAGWGDSCVLVPWANYLNNGDVQTLKSSYPAMKTFLAGVQRMSGFMSAGQRKYIWSHGYSYGDWCAPYEVARQWMGKKKWISTAYFANSTKIASKTAEILGNDNEAEQYSEISEKVTDAYRNVFTDKNGKLRREFQTAYVCPLYFGMTEDEETKAYAKNLVRLVEKADNHLSTGFLGTPFLLFALADNGYADKAYEVLMQDTFPSWLYEVKAGATTIWERWDALRPDGTVNLGEMVNENSENVGGMVSFNHYANGAVGDFLYRRTAGIEATAPGYSKFRIAPVPGGGLTYVKCRKHISTGDIKSEWMLIENKFELKVNVPFNTTAEIILPNGEKHTASSGEYIFKCEI